MAQALACLATIQAVSVAQVVEGSLQCLSLGNSVKERVRPEISHDGRVVAFVVKAPHPGERTWPPPPSDLVHVVGLESGRTDVLPLEADGQRWNLGVLGALSLSDDGSRLAVSAMRWLAEDKFPVGAEVAVLLVDVTDGHARRLHVPPELGSVGRAPSLAACSRYALLPTHARPEQPLYGTSCLARLDLETGTVDRLRVEGELLQPVRWSVSADATLIVMDGFRSPDARCPDCSGLYVWSPGQEAPEALVLPTLSGPPNGLSSWPAISAAGDWLAFVSRASNLVAGDTNEADDAFVLDLRRGMLQRVSVATDRCQVEAHVQGPLSLSEDGRFVAFMSHGQGLDPNDKDQMQDAFVHDRLTGRTVRVNVSDSGTSTGAFECGPPALSGDGSTVVFATRERLVPEDNNSVLDVYVRHLAWGEGSR